MDRIGIRELRGDLASLVRRAGAGQRVVITIDGRPVAQLGPLEPVESSLTLEDLAARGELIPARRTVQSERPVPEDPHSEGMSMPMWAGTRIEHLLREVRGR